MGARIEQPAIVMLAVNLDEECAQLAEHRRRGRLVVDESAAATVGLDDPPDDERLAGFGLQPIFLKQLGHRMIGGQIEARGHHRLRRSIAH